MKKSLLSVLIITSVLISCKKDKNASSVQEPATLKKISKLIYTYESDPAEVQTFTYDAQGRPASYLKGTRKDIFNFESATRLVVTRYKTTDNSIDAIIECSLNSKGAITKMDFKNSSGVITYTYELTYNADGYNTGVKGYNSSSVYEETVEVNNGNFTSAKRYYGGVLTYNDEFTYNTYQNTTPGGFFSYWPVANLFGKPSKNLFAEVKSVKLNGEVITLNKNTYERDASGNVLKMYIDFTVDGKKGIYEYSYE